MPGESETGNKPGNKPEITNTNTQERINAMANRRGVFGFGFSNNSHLDLLNLIVLACSGLIIAIFFRGKNDPTYGLTGPSASLIWGYGITAIALFLMLFMSFYLKNEKNDLKKSNQIFVDENKNEGLIYIISKLLLNNSLPILLTFFTLIYAIILNINYYTKINSGKIPDTYNTYEFFFIMLIVIQIGIIVKYMYTLLHQIDGSQDLNKDKQSNLLKCITYVISTINAIFLMILHILLVFFSTDG